MKRKLCIKQYLATTQSALLSPTDSVTEEEVEEREKEGEDDLRGEEATGEAT